jgi:hypothetical protein
MRIITDSNKPPEYINTFNGDNHASLTLYPILGLNIVRETSTDENGAFVKPTWNPNDMLTMNKYSIPVFINELNSIYQALKLPDAYKYTGKRLELNESIASEHRKVFMIGQTTVELSMVVITQVDESRVEGIKMKFNNEQSSVLLTINDIETLLFNLTHSNIDLLAVNLYNFFRDKSPSSKSLPDIDIQPIVDIQP